MNLPAALAIDVAGNIYFADQFNNRIREISAGIITTVAGNGNGFLGDPGDNGPALDAAIFYPEGVAVDNLGNVYASDLNGRIRKINSQGIITTIAGNGMNTFAEDIPATQGGIESPTSIALDSSGILYMVEMGTALIRALVPIDDTCGYSVNQDFYIFPAEVPPAHYQSGLRLAVHGRYQACPNGLVPGPWVPGRSRSSFPHCPIRVIRVRRRSRWPAFL
jgi:hypothetical protein